MTRTSVTAALAFLAASAALGLPSCAAPPWRMGSPLDGRPSIPPTQARRTPAESRAAAVAARAAGRPALEIVALAELQRSDHLNDAERERFIDLLVSRAAAFHDMGRAIPESGDLEAAAALGARGEALTRERAVASAAAGDAWKAMGAQADARAAYARAVMLGGVPPDVAAPVPTAAPAPPSLPADVDGWVYAGPALSTRLLPLATAFPAVLDDVPRALAWAEILLSEDPTSPDVLELVALIFGRAGRFGGTERMLMELTYHSPDRATGLARGAVVWERLGRPREACASWIRAARWRNEAEDAAWKKAVSCARKDPGAGDWKEVRDYALNLASPERRQALAAELDAAGEGDAGAPAAGPPAAAPVAR
jgi:tetratricopeptide (TPR) repeat protein